MLGYVRKRESSCCKKYHSSFPRSDIEILPSTLKPVEVELLASLARSEKEKMRPSPNNPPKVSKNLLAIDEKENPVATKLNTSSFISDELLPVVGPSLLKSYSSLGKSEDRLCPNAHVLKFDVFVSSPTEIIKYIHQHIFY